jgi:hypothetical protein
VIGVDVSDAMLVGATDDPGVSAVQALRITTHKNERYERFVARMEIS